MSADFYDLCEEAWADEPPAPLLWYHKDMLTSKESEERFWSRVTKRGDDECWLFRDGEAIGYGTIRLNGKYMGAHRAAWVFTNGPIPKGLCVCHKCDVPSCCNPAHLFLGTYADNSQDAMRKGRLSQRPAFDKNEYWRMIKREQRLRLRAAGICIICGTAKVPAGRSTCHGCGEKANAAARARRAAKMAEAVYAEILNSKREATEAAP